MAPEADPTNLQGLLQEVVRELRLGCEGAAGDRMRVFLEQMAAWLADWQNFRLVLCFFLWLAGCRLAG